MDKPAGESLAAFKSVTDNVVKSVTQRQMLRYWERLRERESVPLWSRINRDAIAASRDHLCVVEIRQEGGRRRYLIREHGPKLAEYYGSACAGKHLDEIMTPQALPTLAVIYDRAIDTRRPVYTTWPITDRQGRTLVCERLLLPFTVSGTGVDVVLTSLEAICEGGAFDQFKVFEPSQREPVAGFQGVIEAPSPR